MKIKDIMAKYRAGDHISDEELMFAIDFLENLERMMVELDDRFTLATNEVRRVYDQLCLFAFHRGLIDSNLQPKIAVN